MTYMAKNSETLQEYCAIIRKKDGFTIFATKIEKVEDGWNVWRTTKDGKAKKLWIAKSEISEIEESDETTE